MKSRSFCASSLVCRLAVALRFVLLRRFHGRTWGRGSGLSMASHSGDIVKVAGWESRLCTSIIAGIERRELRQRNERSDEFNWDYRVARMVSTHRRGGQSARTSGRFAMSHDKTWHEHAKELPEV
eukprot:13152010-Ditylum_brightwellii.AAC.1